MEAIPESMTISEAKSILREKAREPGGCTCCVCGQTVKVYRRKFNKVMARGLVIMYRRDEQIPGGWIHVHDDNEILNVTRGSGDLAKCRYFELIEREKDDDNRGTGRWRITDKGKAFVEGRCRIPKYAHVYNNRCLGMSEDKIGIDEAIDAPFDLTEIKGMVPEKEINGRLF